MRQKVRTHGSIRHQTRLKWFLPAGSRHRLEGHWFTLVQRVTQGVDIPTSRRYRAQSRHENPVHAHLLKIKVALTPPKPNELDNTTFTRASWGLLTIGNLQAGSGVSNSISGGSHCSRKAIRQITASTAPAPPSRCPMLAFVELTGNVAARRAAHSLIANASELSLSTVPVPCALM